MVMLGGVISTPCLFLISNDIILLLLRYSGGANSFTGYIDLMYGERIFNGPLWCTDPCSQ